MKAYSEYKTADLPWLQQVPAHWRWLRHKNIYSEQKALVGNQKSKYNLLSLTKQGIIIRDISNGKGKFPKDFDTYKVVHPGDMVFCLFDVDETPRTVGLSEHYGMITGAYDIFHVSNILPKYAYYFYLALDNIKAFKPLYSGLRKVIPLPTFLATKTPIPPENEQIQIVRFVDWKVSEINRLIKGMRSEITALKELKLSIIDHAVTCGIDGSVTLKDSGHSWIDRIPEHWNMEYSKQFFALRKEKAKEGDEQLTASQHYGIISQKRFMEIENRRITVVVTGEDILKHVEKGDFVISMRSFQGGIEYSTVEGKISSAYVMLIPDHKFVYDDYFKWLFKSPSYIKALQGTSDLVRDGQALRYSNFAKVYLPNIPLGEQKEIADYLNKRIPIIDSAIEGIKREMRLLDELKRKIIFDAVTGRIDVRDVVIPEYEIQTDDSYDIETDDEESFSDDMTE